MSSNKTKPTPLEILDEVSHQAAQAAVARRKSTAQDRDWSRALLSQPEPGMARIHSLLTPVDLLVEGAARHHLVDCCHPGVGYQLGQGVTLGPGSRERILAPVMTCPGPCTSHLLVVDSQSSTDGKVGPVASELAHQLGLEVLDAGPLSEDEIRVATSGDPHQQVP